MTEKQVAGISERAAIEKAESPNRNPCLFIVGCARSGTTLLQRMVDAHPLIAVINETHWIVRWMEKQRGVTPEGFVTPELVPKLLDHARFAQFLVGREDLERLMGSGEPIPYSGFVSAIFDLYGERKGKPLVGDKTPSYVRSIPTLHALFPTAKFVHLIRDGRDVCLSAMSWKKAFKLAHRFATWNEDPVTTAAVWWEWLVRLGREDGTLLEPNLYCEVRYESLVKDPAGMCAALCEFLGVPYDDAMTRFHEGRTRTDPGLDSKEAWLPVTVGLRDWRSEMRAEDAERFEAAAGDLIDELGYPRAVPNPFHEGQEHAARIRDSFLRDVRARGNRLPAIWRDVPA